MANFVKSLIAHIPFAIGLLFDKVGKLLVSTGSVFYSISATLHIQMETRIGKQLKAVEEGVKALMAKAQALNARAQQAQSLEENKLANIVKPDNNVLQLGKKKDDDPKN